MENGDGVLDDEGPIQPLARSGAYMVQVAIVGSCNYPSRQLVEDYVGGLHAGSVVVSGGAPGVDTWAAEAATKNGLEVIVHEAEWDKHGRRAGPLRNEKIVADADKVVGFWDGKSRGTLNTLAIAVDAGVPVDVIGPAGESVSLADALSAADEAGVLKAISEGRKRMLD